MVRTSEQALLLTISRSHDLTISRSRGGPMSSFKVFDIAGSGMSAQSVRLNTTASNLANVESVGSDPKQVYKAKHPIFEAVRAGLAGTKNPGAAVRVKDIVESQATPTARYEPGNPLADANGYVYA